MFPNLSCWGALSSLTRTRRIPGSVKGLHENWKQYITSKLMTMNRRRTHNRAHRPETQHKSRSSTLYTSLQSHVTAALVDSKIFLVTPFPNTLSMPCIVICLWNKNQQNAHFYTLTLNLLTTTIVAPPSNASKWQMGFNSAFKGLWFSFNYLPSTRLLIWTHERNAIKLHVHVFLRMNSWMVETCRRH
jgi:hypothetical protein